MTGRTHKQKQATPAEPFRFSGHEEPDAMTDEELALSDAVFDRLAKKWRAEDIASGRLKVKPPRKRSRSHDREITDGPAEGEPKE